jgi:MSHA pilin protein MshC
MGSRMYLVKETGFTMVELIVIMIIVGIMAVTVLPRMDGLTSFDAIGYADQLKAVLRHAQKSALAQRRAVIVDFSGALPTLAHTSGSACAASGTPMNYPASLHDRGPSTALPGVSGGLSSAWVCFDTLGKPYGSSLAAMTATATINITGATAISIEPETGYVH